MKKTATYPSVFGPIRIDYKDNIVISLKKVNDEIVDHGEHSTFSDHVFAEVEEYFSGKRKSFSFQFQLIGTPFQQKVWETLCNIPYGQTCSYKDVAIAIGNPKAARAIGMANNKNPITIVVPCHRVVESNGKLGGYAGGLEMKKGLLKIEGAL